MKYVLCCLLLALFALAGCEKPAATPCDPCPSCPACPTPKEAPR